MRFNVCFLGLLSLMATTYSSQAYASNELVLATNNAATSYILIASNASEAESLAADELQHYIKAMTNVAIPIQRGDRLLKNSNDTGGANSVAILIGCYNTNPLIGQMITEGTIKLDSAEITPDGFLIKSVQRDDQSCLVLAGVNEHATLYAVYDLLERFGRIGFFRYEERVPKRDTFTIPASDIRERAYFKTRMHGGQYHYFGTQFFGEKDWQSELRWFAKYRLNRINYIPGPALGEKVSGRGWQRMGVDIPADVIDANDANLQLNQRLSRYGINLGVHAPYPTTDGSIAPPYLAAFKAKYPDANYLVLDASHVYVHPSDPLWLEMNQNMLRDHIEIFGQSSVFALPTPYTEQSPGETHEEQEALTTDYANAVGQLAKWSESQYPGVEWVWDGWVFANKAYWTPRRVKRLLDALPSSLDMMIWDYPAEDEPTYVLQNYWHGRPWAYIVCHSMAGNTSVHGDVNRIAGETFRVLADQRADQTLQGFGYYTEARDYIPFFQDYILHLAWNPLRNVDEFVADYCERRYEPESVQAMIACHQKLLKTVYGPQSDTHLTHGFRTVRAQDPVYWFTIGANWVPFDGVQHRVAVMQNQWAPQLRDALADALSVYDREKNNPAYVRDLADIMRSYVHVRVNMAVWNAADAARRGDRENFNHNYQQIERLFDQLLLAIGLVTDRWEYSVAATIEEFKDAPIARSDDQIRHHLYYVTFGGDRIYDYARSDRYEMIRDLYRPFTMSALDGMRQQLDEGNDVVIGTAPSASNGNYGTIMDVVKEQAHIGSSSGQQAVINQFITGPCALPPSPADAKKVVEGFLALIKQGQI